MACGSMFLVGCKTSCEKGEYELWAGIGESSFSEPGLDPLPLAVDSDGQATLFIAIRAKGFTLPPSGYLDGWIQVGQPELYTQWFSSIPTCNEEQEYYESLGVPLSIPDFVPGLYSIAVIVTDWYQKPGVGEVKNNIADLFEIELEIEP